ncbi:Sequence-specific DNA binding [Coemansia furcata]|uniref:Sequence-specific DNA binding n=1 Tax=Coemansia furcata TaxID=417177 RepID=A0ACC1LQA2_9FUNG|nr:Sequence-specific DNA binding [Coemansia furcata]
MSDTTTIDDLDFPKAVLTRLIKSSLPENISIQKEARHGVAKASTVFVSYLAATANDCARESGHKTIMTADVLKALEALGLADFVDRLKADLDVFVNKTKEKKLSKTNNPTTGDDEDIEEDEEEDVADAPDTLDAPDALEDAMDVADVSVVAMDVDDTECADPAKRPRTE